MSLVLRRIAGLASIGACLLSAPSARAATWEGGRTTPSIGELIAIDATGEPDWFFGFEDLAGDGDTFDVPEQSVDIRTGYATTDATSFWVRAYVSNPDAVSADIVLYVFLDNDIDETTGGTADTDLDPSFTDDPTLGGYEVAFAIRGDGTVDGVFTWNDAQGAWDIDNNPDPNDIEAEIDVDVDRIGGPGDVHGYLQGIVNLGLLGIDDTCEARIHLRSVDEGPDGASDLDVGLESTCIPEDANADGIPDAAVPVDGCVDDLDCPFDGICLDGECYFAGPCTDGSECDDDETCTDGICIVIGGGSCTVADDCDGLACIDGTCSGCISDDQCGTGFRCGPDGRCVDDAGGGGVVVGPGEVVRGGPCACRAAGEQKGGAGVLAALALALVALRRGRRR